MCSGYSAQLSELSSRIAKLESERSVLRRTIEGVDQELSALGQTLDRTEVSHTSRPGRRNVC